ncbi:MAG: MFS transporter, partial [Chloroflexi bacterium]|nr:MFS transporter [Chloroflexota bacterium]
VMALGAVFYMVGFAMYGFVSTYILFLLAMVVITIGEMLIAPMAQTLIAKFSPDNMRGRYMVIAGFTVFAIPSAVVPFMAGLVMKYYDPRWVWWGGGIIAIFVVAGYLVLHVRAGERFGEMTATLSDPSAATSEAAA